MMDRDRFTENLYTPSIKCHERTKGRELNEDSLDMQKKEKQTINTQSRRYVKYEFRKIREEIGQRKLNLSYRGRYEGM